MKKKQTLMQRIRVAQKTRIFWEIRNDDPTPEDAAILACTPTIDPRPDEWVMNRCVAKQAKLDRKARGEAWAAKWSK